MIKKTLFITFLTVSCSAMSKDLGVYGELFPVIEENMITAIQNNLREVEKRGGFEQLQEEMYRKAQENLERPTPVLTVKATQNSKRLFDPSVTLTKDLKDDKGLVFAKKGTVINPLDHIAFGRTLYFIDADDATQINWLKKQVLLPKDQVILTNGNTIETEQQIGRQVYFDQNAQWVKRFQLRALPSVVSKQGNKLLIKEVFTND